MCSALLAAAGLTLLLGTAPAAPTGSAQAPGVVAFPGIRIIPLERRIEIDAAFAVVGESYFLEFLAVAPHGKIHESLLEVRCEPEKLNFGLIACGLVPVAEVQFQGEARELKGPRVAVEAEWKDEKGVLKRVRVEDLLVDVRLGKPMERVGFAFTGSRFIKTFAGPARRPSGPGGPGPAPPSKGAGLVEVFAATASGSAIALYHDPDAVLDNPLLSGGDVPLLAPTLGLVEVAGWVPGDERLRPAPGLPAQGTPVTLHVRPLP